MLPAVERFYRYGDEFTEDHDNGWTPDREERWEELYEVMSTRPVAQLQEGVAESKFLINVQRQHMTSKLLQISREKTNHVDKTPLPYPTSSCYISYLLLFLNFNFLGLLFVALFLEKTAAKLLKVLQFPPAMQNLEKHDVKILYSLL